MSDRIRLTSISAGLTLTLLAPVAGRSQSAETTLSAAVGFRVERVADGLPAPTGLAFGPDGRLYVALREGGRVVSLSGPQDAVATTDPIPVLDGLLEPSDLAFRGSELWVIDSRRLVRALLPFDSGGRQADIALDSLPGQASSIVFLPALDGALVAIEAVCETCGEGAARPGAILHVSADTVVPRLWAAGFLRVSAMAVQPVTGVLWATETGRRDLGSELPTGELNTVYPGRHYGWPYCFGVRVPAPEYADRARCDLTEPPAIGFTAASAPIDIVFYAGESYPPDFRGDAFVALAGVRSQPTHNGMRVVRVRFSDGRPVGVENFVSGWLERSGRLGRPAGLAVGPDGSLYISDDLGGRIWRVVYDDADDGGGPRVRARRN